MNYSSASTLNHQPDEQSIKIQFKLSHAAKTNQNVIWIWQMISFLVSDNKQYAEETVLIWTVSLFIASSTRTVNVQNQTHSDVSLLTLLCKSHTNTTNKKRFYVRSIVCSSVAVENISLHFQIYILLLIVIIQWDFCLHKESDNSQCSTQRSGPVFIKLFKVPF